MKAVANELIQILSHIEQSRVTWYDHTRKLIQTELNAIVASAKLDWFIDVNDSIINHETITLRFRNKPSGLVYNDENTENQQDGKSGSIVKYGGTLNFSFVYLGDVMIWMTYPYIPEILENTENFIDLVRIKQEKLDQQVIHEAVEKFLHEMVSWHTGKIGREHRIGFKTSPAEE